MQEALEALESAIPPGDEPTSERAYAVLGEKEDPSGLPPKISSNGCTVRAISTKVRAISTKVRAISTKSREYSDSPITGKSEHDIAFALVADGVSTTAAVWSEWFVNEDGIVAANGNEIVFDGESDLDTAFFCCTCLDNLFERIRVHVLVQTE
ncbi:hypothetical protein [Haladaptatus paucihalophilus]|uniref:hypothetical protein n=1 Tax=Haladaptatus paucihalophilus TaxID=367189 RepID=UPI001E4FD5E4|nr:hypothetical protein [Haladaptatus paucihalophilus]